MRFPCLAFLAVDVPLTTILASVARDLFSLGMGWIGKYVGSIESVMAREGEER